MLNELVTHPLVWVALLWFLPLAVLQVIGMARGEEDDF